jgi:hypothetical protein
MSPVRGLPRGPHPKQRSLPPSKEKFSRMKALDAHMEGFHAGHAGDRRAHGGIGRAPSIGESGGFGHPRRMPPCARPQGGRTAASARNPSMSAPGTACPARIRSIGRSLWGTSHRSGMEVFVAEDVPGLSGALPVWRFSARSTLKAPTASPTWCHSSHFESSGDRGASCMEEFRAHAFRRPQAQVCGGLPADGSGACSVRHGGIRRACLASAAGSVADLLLLGFPCRSRPPADVRLVGTCPADRDEYLHACAQCLHKRVSVRHASACGSQESLDWTAIQTQRPASKRELPVRRCQN